MLLIAENHHWESSESAQKFVILACAVVVFFQDASLSSYPFLEGWTWPRMKNGWLCPTGLEGTTSWWEHHCQRLPLFSGSRGAGIRDMADFDVGLAAGSRSWDLKTTCKHQDTNGRCSLYLSLDGVLCWCLKYHEKSIFHQRDVDFSSWHEAISWVVTRENKALSGPGQWPKTSSTRFKEWDLWPWR